MRASCFLIYSNTVFSHRGSILASHLSVPLEEIEDPQMLEEKLKENPISSVLKEMMDLKILLNPLFALICISNIFGKL